MWQRERASAFREDRTVPLSHDLFRLSHADEVICRSEALHSIQSKPSVFTLHAQHPIRNYIRVGVLTLSHDDEMPDSDNATRPLSSRVLPTVHFLALGPSGTCNTQLLPKSTGALDKRLQGRRRPRKCSGAPLLALLTAPIGLVTHRLMLGLLVISRYPMWATVPAPLAYKGSNR